MKKLVFKLTLLLATLTLTTQARAHGKPSIGGRMLHINITRPSPDVLNVALGRMNTNAVATLNTSHPFSPDQPFSILNNKGYTARYGLMPGLGISMDDRIRITRIQATPGLLTYQGGETPHLGTFAPILGTDATSDVWEMPALMMWHNWYAAEQPGIYTATYKVDLLNQAGDVLVSSEPLVLKFDGSNIPEPASILTLGLVSLACINRRR